MVRRNILAKGDVLAINNVGTERVEKRLMKENLGKRDIFRRH